MFLVFCQTTARFDHHPMQHAALGTVQTLDTALIILHCCNVASTTKRPTNKGHTFLTVEPSFAQNKPRAHLGDKNSIPAFQPWSHWANTIVSDSAGPFFWENRQGHFQASCWYIACDLILTAQTAIANGLHQANCERTSSNLSESLRSWRPSHSSGPSSPLLGGSNLQSWVLMESCKTWEWDRGTHKEMQQIEPRLGTNSSCIRLNLLHYVTMCIYNITSFCTSSAVASAGSPTSLSVGVRHAHHECSRQSLGQEKGIWALDEVDGVRTASRWRAGDKFFSSVFAKALLWRGLSICFIWPSAFSEINCKQFEPHEKLTHT